MTGNRSRIGPRIDYDDCMKWQVLDLDGQPLEDEAGAVTVQRVHATHWRNLIKQSIKVHPAHVALKADLTLLIYRYQHDRWFSLETLARYGVELPVRRPDGSKVPLSVKEKEVEAS